MGNEKLRPGTMHNAAYGNFILAPMGNHTFAEKNYSCSSAEERSSLLSLISILRELDIPTILRIVEVFQEQVGSYQIVVQYEYCPISLEQAIQTKKNTYFKYTESEICIFIDCVLSGLMALSFKNMNHRDLRPSNIMIGQHHEDPKQKLYKIGYPLLMNPETMEKTYTPSNINVYFGPQMFEAVCKLSNRSFSLEKNDVYALGLIALEMATLAPVATVYDHQSGQVNALEIDKRLRVCRQHYSEHLTALLRDMLMTDEDKRPNFSEVFTVLEPLLEVSPAEQQPQQGTPSKVIEPLVVSATSIHRSHRKIEVTTNKNLIRSPVKPTIRQLTPKSILASQKSIKNVQQTSHLPTFCKVTQHSFLAEIHVRQPYPHHTSPPNINSRDSTTKKTS